MFLEKRQNGTSNPVGAPCGPIESSGEMCPFPCLPAVRPPPRTLLPTGPPPSFTSFTWDLCTFVLWPFGLGTLSHLEIGSLGMQHWALWGHEWKTKRTLQIAWARTWDTEVLSFPKVRLFIIPACFKVGSWELPLQRGHWRSRGQPSCHTVTFFKITCQLLADSMLRKAKRWPHHRPQYNSEDKHSETREQTYLITFYRHWCLIYSFVFWIGKIVTWVSVSEIRILMRKFPMGTLLKWNFQNLLWHDSSINWAQVI